MKTTHYNASSHTSKKGTAVSFSKEDKVTRKEQAEIQLVPVEYSQKEAVWLAQVSMVALNNISRNWRQKLTSHGIEIESLHLCLTPFFEPAGKQNFNAVLQIAVKPVKNLPETDLALATQLVEQAANEVWSERKRTLAGFGFRLISVEDWVQNGIRNEALRD